MLHGFRMCSPVDKSASIGFLYYLRCPDTDAVRYVGSTVNVASRYNGHIADANLQRERGHFGSAKERWITSLLEQGKYPVLEIVGVVPVEFLTQAERMLYESCKQFGYDLTNGTTPSNNVSYGKRTAKAAS